MITRRKRTEILIRGRKDTLRQLATDIESRYDIKLLQSPQNALVMVKMRESAKAGLFYLGEVLITESKVILNQWVGTGIIRGHDPESAYMLAVIDAAYNAELPIINEWEETLLSEELWIQTKQRMELEAVHSTKVNFESMKLDI